MIVVDGTTGKVWGTDPEIKCEFCKTHLAGDTIFQTETYINEQNQETHVYRRIPGIVFCPFCGTRLRTRPILERKKE